MAGKNLNRQRLDPGIAQQPDDDLPLALFAVAVIAEGGPFIADPSETAAGDNLGKKHKIRTDPLAMEGHGALRLQVRLKGSRECLGPTQLDSTNATGIAFSDGKPHASDT